MDASVNQNPDDASTHPDAQQTETADSGGVSGQGAGAGGSRGGGATDASVEAGASVVDASRPAADSGSTGAAGGAAGSGGSGGAIQAIPFDNCKLGTGVLFCNGFEEPKPWQPYPPYPYSTESVTQGSYDPSTTTKYYGAASGHFMTTGSSPSSGSRVAYRQLQNKMSGDLWLRYYYYLPRSVNLNASFTAGVMSEVSGKSTGFTLLIQPTTIAIQTGLSLMSSPASYVFPRDTWLCIEHHVFIDPTSGYVEIYIDGERLLFSQPGNSVPSQGYMTVDVGIDYVGNKQMPVDVYVDNVVISTSQFGCDAR